MTVMQPRRTVGPLCLAIAALLAPPVHGQDQDFHILVTNDDGVESPGIQALAEALRAVGRVHVIAPCSQRSGASMSVSLRDDLTLQSVPREGGDPDACVDASPANTVLLAISTLAPPDGFDLVVSGINRGANLGTASHLSGTVGAAMMGAFLGVPALAVSSGARSTDYGYAARFTATFVEQLRQHAAVPGIVFSINLPHATEAETAGVTFATMGQSRYRLAYAEIPGEGGARQFRPDITRATDAAPGTDTEAYQRDMITITPLLFDWTAYAVLDQVRDWTLTHEVGP